MENKKVFLVIENKVLKYGDKANKIPLRSLVGNPIAILVVGTYAKGSLLDQILPNSVSVVISTLDEYKREQMIRQLVDLYMNWKRVFGDDINKQFELLQLVITKLDEIVMLEEKKNE